MFSIRLGFEAFKLFNLIEKNPEGVNLDQICKYTGKAKGAAGKAVSRLRLKDLIFSEIQGDATIYKATGANAEIRPQDAEAWEAFVAEQPAEAPAEALTPSPVAEIEGSVEEMEGNPGPAVNDETGEETAAGEPLPPVQEEKPAPKPAKAKKSKPAGTGGRTKYDYSGWPVQKGDTVTYLRGKKGNQTTHEGTVTRLMVYAQQKGEHVVKIQPKEGGKQTTVRLKLVTKKK